MLKLKLYFDNIWFKLIFMNPTFCFQLNSVLYNIGLIPFSYINIFHVIFSTNKFIRKLHDEWTTNVKSKLKLNEEIFQLSTLTHAALIIKATGTIFAKTGYLPH
jgi:hypothetical protein